MGEKTILTYKVAKECAPAVKLRFVILEAEAFVDLHASFQKQPTTEGSMQAILEIV